MAESEYSMLLRQAQQQRFQTSWTIREQSKDFSLKFTTLKIWTFLISRLFIVNIDHQRN
jgi:hypothetical protein